MFRPDLLEINTRPQEGPRKLILLLLSSPYYSNTVISDNKSCPRPPNWKALLRVDYASFRFLSNSSFSYSSLQSKHNSKKRRVGALDTEKKRKSLCMPAFTAPVKFENLTAVQKHSLLISTIQSTHRSAPDLMFLHYNPFGHWRRRYTPQLMSRRKLLRYFRKQWRLDRNTDIDWQ